MRNECRQFRTPHSELRTPMIERREFISICRQIGAMMEVGVDFLRITHALRSQTDNARLLELYDQLDADLKEGDSLSEAMSHAPDVFSPFAVSLVQQGERRGNIEAAWERIADFFQQQAREDLEIGSDSAPLEPAGGVFGSAGNTQTALPILPRTRSGVVAGDFWEQAQLLLARLLVGTALLLVVLIVARALVELGVVPHHYGASLEMGAAALFLLLCGALLLRRPDETQTAHCAFCGRVASGQSPLNRSKRDPNTFICADCAVQIAQSAPSSEAYDALREEERGERLRALRDVADALPERSGLDSQSDDDTIVLDDDDPLAPPRAA